MTDRHRAPGSVPKHKNDRQSPLSSREWRDRLDAERYQETAVYHWDRILMAIVMVLAAVALLIWAWSWFTTPEETATVIAPASEVATDERLKVPAQPQNPDGQVQRPEGGPASTTSANPDATRAAGTEGALPGQNHKQDSVQSDPADTTTPQAQAQASQDAVGASGSADETSSSAPAVASENASGQGATAPAPQTLSSSDTPTAGSVDKPESASDAQETAGASSAASAAPEDKAESAAQTPAEPVYIINSPHVAQIQLTSALTDKDPTDNLGPVLTMNAKGLLHPYLYTELKGLNGQVVYHDWYLGDRRMAHVSIRPYLDDMRASTSKFITKNMLGPWSVRVVNRQGKVLAETRFKVVAEQP